MTSRGRTSTRATKKPIIVLAGEASNDHKAMRILLEAFCPNSSGHIVEINDNVRLRNASEETLRNRVKILASSVRARAERERASIRCVFVHEDFDAVDSPNRVLTRKRVESALRRELAGAHYVLATWEMEAWLLLFPQALTAFSSSWALPSRYRSRDTSRIEDPKRVMREEVAKTGAKYRESDSVKIFEKIVTLGLQEQPKGKNNSFNEFHASTLECCQTLSS